MARKRKQMRRKMGKSRSVDSTPVQNQNYMSGRTIGGNSTGSVSTLPALRSVGTLTPGFNSGNMKVSVGR